jgi:hypothetical protein
MTEEDRIFLGACILMSGRNDKYSEPDTMWLAVKNAKALWEYYLAQESRSDDQPKAQA